MKSIQMTSVVVSFKEKFENLQNRRDLIQLVIITVFAISSLLFIVYIYWYGDPELLKSYYSLIPHLYLIPIILLALWYPRTGLQITLLVIITIVVLTTFLYLNGVIIDPVLSLFIAGMDIGLFVVIALYIKDCTLVESILRDFFESAGFKESFDASVAKRNRPGKATFERAFEDVVKALHTSDDEIREEAVKVLGGLNDPRAVDPLIAVLCDNNQDIRIEASRALGNTGDERAIEPLINAMKDDDRHCREEAAQGVAKIGKKALSPLVEALNNGDWHVRMGSAVALRIIGDKSAINPLISVMGDENYFVRREATKSLGRIGDKRVIDPLIKALKDPDSGVRLRAVSMLSKCGGGKVIEPLIMAIDDKNQSVRLRVISVLEEIDDPRVIQALADSASNETELS